MDKASTYKRVLVIEDDDLLREVITLTIQCEGFEVIAASNGKEAISLLLNPHTSLAVDLILVDLIMPVMDGLHFLRWLRQESKLTIPAIVLSGRKTTHTWDEVKSAGGTDLIYKPLEAEDLIAKIKQTIGVS